MEQDWFPSPPPQPGQYCFRFIGHKPQFKPHKEKNKLFRWKFFIASLLKSIFLRIVLRLSEYFDFSVSHHAGLAIRSVPFLQVISSGRQPQLPALLFYGEADFLPYLLRDNRLLFLPAGLRLVRCFAAGAGGGKWQDLTYPSLQKD